MRRGQQLLDQLVQPALAVAQSLGNVGVKLPTPVLRIQLGHTLEEGSDLRDFVVKHA